MEPAFAARQACLAAFEIKAFNLLVKTLRPIIAI